MNWKVMGLVLLTSLPLIASAQGTAGVEKNPPLPVAGTEQPSAAQIYEDIEIMRRLLNGKLQSFAPQSQPTLWLASSAACTNCHATTVNNGDFLNRSYLRPQHGELLVQDPWHVGLRNTLGQYEHLYHGERLNRLLVGKRHWTAASPARSLDTEGTYIKGQGVIFTMTLPPPARDPRPEPPKPAPQPPTEWERIRKEVRQEKPPAEEAAKPAKEPTLADVILKVLADNGRHFTQLGAHESLILAITFRNPEPTATVVTGPGGGYIDYDGDGFFDISLAAGLDLNAAAQPQQSPKEDKSAAKPAAEDANHKKVKDLLLLGELHLKQNKTDEAIKVLRQALELKPEGEQAATTNKNLAQALIAAQKYDEAAQALQKAAEWVKQQQAQTQPKMEPKNAAPPSPLPSKLVITVYKPMLDDIGNGKMSFEDFKKVAKVEYITFAGEKK